MSEQGTGESAPHRQFVITQKTPYEWLASQRSSTDMVVRKQVAADIVKNAQELEPEVVWPDIIGRITYRDRAAGGTFRSIRAVEMDTAATVASVARNMGWGMDAPEIVFMSGQYFVNTLTGSIYQLNDRIREAEEGRRKFVTEGNKEETLARERDEAGRLGAFRRRIGDSAGQYAENEGLNTEYQEALRELLKSTGSRMSSIRARALEHIKQGNYSEATRIIQEARGQA